MKIAIIAFYFGKLPNYFNLWLLSAGRNMDIDFFFFTDSTEQYDFPKNVRKIQTTFEEVKERLQKNIDIEIALSAPYKICDYRPVFGLAFKDYLEGYDFWGHCDIDLIFGDIRQFVTDEVLNNYDKIYNRGYITFYRNNKQMQELFLQKHNCPFDRYDEAFCTNYVFSFDECGICDIADMLRVKTFNEITYADINVYYNNFILCFIQDKYTNQIWRWEKGKLFREYLADGNLKCEEMLLIHLQKRKMSIELVLENNSVDSFLIVPNSFIPNKEILPSDVINYSKSKFYKEKYIILAQLYKRLLSFEGLRRRFMKYKKKIIYKISH